jgi:asparagine synthase (glutamine-hydrolysing)
MHRIARERGIDAFFSGNGGDNIFYYTQSATPSPTGCWTHGIGIGLLQTWRDVCRLTGCTPVEAALASWGSIRTRGRGYQWRPDPRFLHCDLSANFARLRARTPGSKIAGRIS